LAKEHNSNYKGACLDIYRVNWL